MGEAQGDVQAPALAPGERRRLPVQQLRQAQGGGQFGGARDRDGLGEPVQPPRVTSSSRTVIGREMVAGRKPAEVSREALDLLDDIEGLLGERVLDYGRRSEP